MPHSPSRCYRCIHLLSLPGGQGMALGGARYSSGFDPVRNELDAPNSFAPVTLPALANATAVRDFGPTRVGRCDAKH